MIQTERLKIEPITLSEAPFIYELLNSESWIKYIGKRDVPTVEAAGNYIKERFIAHFEQWGFGIYTVRLHGDDTPLGIITLLKKPHLDSPDIGYAFLDRHAGKGYAIEATKAVYDFAKSNLAMTRLVAVVLENNPRSIRVLEKLGFQFEQKIQQGDEELLLFADAPLSKIN